MRFGLVAEPLEAHSANDRPDGDVHLRYTALSFSLLHDIFTLIPGSRLGDREYGMLQGMAHILARQAASWLQCFYRPHSLRSLGSVCPYC